MVIIACFNENPIEESVLSVATDSYLSPCVLKFKQKSVIT